MKIYFGSINFGVDFFLALTIIPPKKFMAVTVSFDVTVVVFLVAGIISLLDEEDTSTYVVVDEVVVEDKSVVLAVVVVVVVGVVVLVVVEGFSLVVAVSADSVPTLSANEYLFPLRG